jgi:hypothetical protein
VGDFHIAFFIAAFLSLLALADVLRLPADAGAAVSGYRGRVAGAGEAAARRG